MAEKDGPPKYEAEQLEPPTESTPVEPGPTKSVVVTLIHRKAGKVTMPSKTGVGSTMGIGMTEKDVLRQRNDAISISTTISRPELVLLLWKRAQVHWGTDVVPDIATSLSEEDSRKPQGFTIIAVIHADKRVTIVDQAGWDAAKGWLFDGTGSLHFDFAVVTPAVLRKDPESGKAVAANEDKKQKKCVVQ